MRPSQRPYDLEEMPWIPLTQIEALGLSMIYGPAFGAAFAHNLARAIYLYERRVPPAITGFLAGLEGKAWPADFPVELPEAVFRLGMPPLALVPSLPKALARLGASRGSATLRYTPRTFDLVVKLCVKDHRGVDDADGRPLKFKFSQGEQGVAVVAPGVVDRYRTLGIRWPIGFALIGLFILPLGEAHHG